MKHFRQTLALALFALFSFSPLSAQTWKTYTPPFPDTIGIADIEVVNANVIWAVGLKYIADDSFYTYFAPSKTYVALTKDGGATWAVNTIPIGSNPFVANLTALDGSAAWVATLNNNGNSKVLKTNDGGATWTDAKVPYDPAASWADYIHSVSPAKIVIVGDPRDGEFEIYTTGNAGQVWNRVPGASIPDPQPNEFGFNNIGDAVGNTIWFGTSTGRVFRSKSGGLSWEAYATPAPYVDFLSFSDESNGMVTSGNFSSTAPATQIYRTANGGETWENVTPASNSFRLVGAECIPNSPYLIMCGTTGSILNENKFKTWVSADRGSTWKEVSSGQIAHWPTFLDGKTGWAGEAQQFSHKTKLYQYIGSPLVGLLTPAALDADVTLSPNPTSDLVRVQVRAREAGDFWVMLHDAQGNLLRKIEVSGAASFDKELIVSDLPAGLYTVTVSGASGSVSRGVAKN